MAPFRFMAAAAVLGVSSVSLADFVDWHFESYPVSVAGADYAVIDVYAQFDGTTDTVLNVFNSDITTSTGVEFHHNDLNTLGGTAGAWNATATVYLPSS